MDVRLTWRWPFIERVPARTDPFSVAALPHDANAGPYRTPLIGTIPRSPAPLGTWWTCGVCGRRSAFTPGALHGGYVIHEVYQPSFWYAFEGVLHCKDCGWRKTTQYLQTKEPPGDGWYHPCDGKPVLEFSRMDMHGRKFVTVLGTGADLLCETVDGNDCWTKEFR